MDSAKKDLTGRYCYSFNGESYYGDFGSIEELKEEIGDGWSEIVIGRYKEPVTISLSGQSLVEDIDCNAGDHYGMEDSIFDFCDGKQEDLAKELEDVIERFFAKHPVRYYTIEEVDKPDDDNQSEGAE